MSSFWFDAVRIERKWLRLIVMHVREWHVAVSLFSLFLYS